MTSFDNVKARLNSFNISEITLVEYDRRKKKKKTYLRLKKRLVSSSCCRHFDTLRWLVVGDWLMLKVGSLIVIVVADGCYGSGLWWWPY
jgi:hypothetical protein